MAGNYWLPALMWSLLILLFLGLPRAKSGGRLRQGRLLRWSALIAVCIALLATVLQGLIGGFGKSPYDHSLLGMAINILSLGAAVTAVEIGRAWLLNRFFRRHPWGGITGIALLFTLFLLPLNRFFSLHNARAWTEFAGGTVVPELSRNFLATYLAFLGGPVPAVIYRGGILALERLSPLLPSGENWVMAALIGTLTPLATLVFIRQVHEEEAGEVKSSRREGNYLSWLGAGLASILIIWFCLGVFSYTPRVILSGSMVPVMNVGDVAIIHKIPGTEAEIGDIVMFPFGNMKVTHRVIAVQEEDGGRYFITKGDASGEPDGGLLAEKNVHGKVVMVVPKLGYLTLWLRGAL